MPRRSRIPGILGYIAFLLVCAELVLQVFYRATAGAWLFERAVVAIWAPNEWSGVFNKSNLAYQHRSPEFEAVNYTNAQGLRVPEGGGPFAFTPPPDTTRILLLGPSFAFGWGVDYEETFGHLLERRLEAEGFGEREHVQLINAGVSSLGPAPQLNWFRHVGRRFQSDLVIQFIYGSMEVESDPRSERTASPEGYLVLPDAPPLARLREHAKKSALVFYSWIAYTRLDQTFSDEQDDEVLGAGRELRFRREFSLDDPAVVEALRYYRALRDATREAGAEVLVVYFPLSYAVHPEDESRWRHLGVGDIAAQAAFDGEFCEHLTSHESLPCLDITSALQSAARAGDERLYYWLDVHWTAAGNRVAAEAVATHLLTEPGDGRQPTSGAVPGLRRVSASPPAGRGRSTR